MNVMIMMMTKFYSNNYNIIKVILIFNENITIILLLFIITITVNYKIMVRFLFYM